jgi:Uncharacterised conserved protein (DUF2368)
MWKMVSCVWLPCSIVPTVPHISFHHFTDVFQLLLTCFRSLCNKWTLLSFRLRSFRKTRNRTLLAPVVPLTFIVAYIGDMAYGTKMTRMRGKKWQYFSALLIDTVYCVSYDELVVDHLLRIMRWIFHSFRDRVVCTISVDVFTCAYNAWIVCKTFVRGIFAKRSVSINGCVLES